jgi:hypothetical protein
VDKIFELRVEKAGDRVSFEVWKDGDEEPITKHQVKVPGVGYFDARSSFQAAVYALTKEVEEWLRKQIQHP